MAWWFPKAKDSGHLSSIGTSHRQQMYVFGNLVDSFGHEERRAAGAARCSESVGCAVLYMGCDVRNALT